MTTKWCGRSILLWCTVMECVVAGSLWFLFLDVTWEFTTQVMLGPAIQQEFGFRLDSPVVRAGASNMEVVAFSYGEFDGALSP